MGNVFLASTVLFHFNLSNIFRFAVVQAGKPTLSPFKHTVLTNTNLHHRQKCKLI